MKKLQKAAKQPNEMKYDFGQQMAEYFHMTTDIFFSVTQTLTPLARVEATSLKRGMCINLILLFIFIQVNRNFSVWVLKEKMD